MFNIVDHNFGISKSPVVSPLETPSSQLMFRPASDKGCHFYNTRSSIVVPIELLQLQVWPYEVGDLVLGIVEFEEEHLSWPSGGSSRQQSCDVLGYKLLDVMSTGDDNYWVTEHLLNKM